MTEPTRATIRQRLYAFLIAGLGGLAASAASFAMAVYEAAHPEQTPVATVGQQIDTGRWFVTVRSARAGTVPPTGTAPPEPKRFVMVDMDVSNRSAMANNTFDDAIALSTPPAGLDQPTIYLDRDKYFAGHLNPDMPERVTVAWQWPKDAPLPERLKLTVIGQIYKKRDNLYGDSNWFDHDPVATVELPVEQAP
jgi:hypothetical protein